MHYAWLDIQSYFVLLMCSPEGKKEVEGPHETTNTLETLALT